MTTTPSSQTETTASPKSPLIGFSLIPFIAPPNGGKGTQTQALSSQLSLPKFDMGAMLRLVGKEESPLGARIRQRQDQGLLVDLDIVIDVLESGLCRLAQENTSALKAIILDGFPRSADQTERLFTLCEHHGMSIGKAFYLDVPTPVIVERASNRRLCSQCPAIYNLASKPPKAENICDDCGSALVHRVDDQADKVQTRLDAFAAETSPILKTFEDRKLLVRVDGNRPPADITAELLHLLG